MKLVQRGGQIRPEEILLQQIVCAVGAGQLAPAAAGEVVEQEADAGDGAVLFIESAVGLIEFPAAIEGGVQVLLEELAFLGGGVLSFPDVEGILLSVALVYCPDLLQFMLVLCALTAVAERRAHMPDPLDAHRDHDDERKGQQHE